MFKHLGSMGPQTPQARQHPGPWPPVTVCHERAAVDRTAPASSCWGFFFKKTKCSISGSWKAGRAVGSAIPKTDRLGVPLCLVEDRRQELGRSHAQGEPLTPPSIVCYCCAQNTAPYTVHPAFPSTVATFQRGWGWALEQCSSPGVCGLIHELACLPCPSPQPPLPHSHPSEGGRSYPTTVPQTHEGLAFWFFLPGFLPARRYNVLAYFVSLACKGT